MNKLNLTHHQDEFLKHLSFEGKSFNTIKNYRTDLNIFNKFLISKKRSLEITELTNQEVKEYGAFLDKTYTSPNSIRRRIQALRLFFDFLLKHELIDENPIKKMVTSPKVVDLPNPPEFHQIKKAYVYVNDLPKNEHEKLLSLRNKVIFHIIFGGALKVSDIENLKMSHVKLSKDHYRILVTHENKEPYTVVMPSSFNSIFEEYKELLETRKDLNQIEFNDLLFNANPFKILSGGLSARGIEVIFKELSKNLEFKMTAKNLRQACIFKWLIQEKPESRIKEWMGVQPQYSLKPYKNLLEQYPAKYCYLEL